MADFPYAFVGDAIDRWVKEYKASIEKDVTERTEALTSGEGFKEEMRGQLDAMVEGVVEFWTNSIARQIQEFSDRLLDDEQLLDGLCSDEDALDNFVRWHVPEEIIRKYLDYLLADNYAKNQVTYDVNTYVDRALEEMGIR